MNRSQDVTEIGPASALAFTIDQGQSLKVVDVQGQQVGDFVAFNTHNHMERFSSGRTRSENGKIRISAGDKLFSNDCHVMFTITRDTCGVHDLLYPPCCRWVFENRYRIPPHDGCLENLCRALSSWRIDRLDIPDPFNIFEHSSVDADGKLSILEPLSRAGSFIELRAEMDCLVGLSACAVDVGRTNAGKCKPLQIVR